MGIVSGGGGGKFNGGTITGALTVAPTTDVIPIAVDAIAGAVQPLLDLEDGTAHSVLTVGYDNRIYSNRFQDTGREVFLADSFNNSGVFVVASDGSLTIHPDANSNVLNLQPRDTTHPALRIAGMTAAPPDSSLNASDLTVWLSATPGATALKIKAKDSGGTVVNQTAEQASPIASGALPTVALVSGTGAQILVARAAETITPVTFNPTAGAAATCVVALSPDNVTYSALGTETEPAGIAFDGTIHLVKVRVPAGWYVRLTVTNATIGTTTYY